MNVLRAKYIACVFISSCIFSFYLLPQSARATDLVFMNFEAEMSSTVDGGGNETLSLLVSSINFGPRGFAAGAASIGGSLPLDGTVGWYVEVPAAPPQ